MAQAKDCRANRRNSPDNNETTEDERLAHLFTGRCPEGVTCDCLHALIVHCSVPNGVSKTPLLKESVALSLEKKSHVDSAYRAIPTAQEIRCFLTLVTTSMLKKNHFHQIFKYQSNACFPLANQCYFSVVLCYVML